MILKLTLTGLAMLSLCVVAVGEIENGQTAAKAQERHAKLLGEAESGGPESKHALFSYVYENSSLLRSEREDALRLLIEAVEYGYAPAQFDLAVLLRKGEWVPQDEEQALGWFMDAAEQDFLPAQFMTGHLLYELAMDEPESEYQMTLLDNSIHWLERAREHADIGVEDTKRAKTFLARSYLYRFPSDLRGWKLLISVVCSGYPPAKKLMEFDLSPIRNLASTGDEDAMKIVDYVENHSGSKCPPNTE